jgi:outer membrane protein assembly factor BamE
MHFCLRFIMLTALTLSCLDLVACSFPPRLYRMDIQQGSNIDPEMISRLRPGMTKEAVQGILGTPTIRHILDTDRFDYYYSLKSGMSGKFIEKHFTVFFRNNRVVNWTCEAI